LFFSSDYAGLRFDIHNVPIRAVAMGAIRPGYAA